MDIILFVLHRPRWPRQVGAFQRGKSHLRFQSFWQKIASQNCKFFHHLNLNFLNNTKSLRIGQTWLKKSCSEETLEFSVQRIGENEIYWHNCSTKWRCFNHHFLSVTIAVLTLVILSDIAQIEMILFVSRYPRRPQQIGVVKIPAIFSHDYTSLIHYSLILYTVSQTVSPTQDFLSQVCQILKDFVLCETTFEQVSETIQL